MVREKSGGSDGRVGTEIVSGEAMKTNSDEGFLGLTDKQKVYKCIHKCIF